MGYEEWAPWSPCSKYCDVGTKSRFRNCLMEKGCTKTMDSQDCNVFPCPSKKLKLLLFIFYPKICIFFLDTG